MTIPQLASSMESQIFYKCTSQEDYMNQVKLFNGVQTLILGKWWEINLDRKKDINNANLMTKYAPSPTVRMMKSDLRTIFNNGLPHYASTADTGSNKPYPVNLTQPYSTASVGTVAKADFHGSQKRSFSAISMHSEQMLPNICSPGERFSFGYPVDSSGPTISGSALRYDYEVSVESRCNKPQYFNEGELNLIFSSNKSSPPVQTPSIVRETSETVAFTNNNDAKMQQPFLECPQCDQQLFQPKVLRGDHLHGKVESFGTVLGQNKSSAAVQKSTARHVPRLGYNGFNLHSLDDVKRRSVNKLLSCYILYNNNCREHKQTFLEVWHSQKCNAGICSCVNTKMLVSHFDKCGSSDCGICGPAVRAHCTAFGDTIFPDTSVGLSNPAKYRRLNSSVKCGSSCDISRPPMDSITHSGSLNFESRSPVIVASENPKARMEMFKGPADDHSCRGLAGESCVDVVLGSNYDDGTGPNEGISADFQDEDTTDMGADVDCELLSDSVPSLREDKKMDQGEEVIARNDGELIEPMEIGSITSLTGMKSEKQKINGISLVSFFTAEEIKQHMSGLRQNAHQVVVDDVVGKAAAGSASDNFCQLCSLAQLSFLPMPIYCSACGERVKKNQSYYFNKDDQAQFCCCTRCYNNNRGSYIQLLHNPISKKNLELRKNNLVTNELWIQCGKCEGWQHQICALFNDKMNQVSKAEYVCPKCHLEDLGTREGVTPPRATSLDASNLPRTLLSNHLEERLFRRLSQEREERAKAAGKNPEEVQLPTGLVVRVVSSVDKRLKVKQDFLDIFPEKNYPSEFPYRSKVILLFQRIEGVDVCLFAMYVQEFGSECSIPNQRCVYISYLDSVKYFRPDVKTLKGEALRTFVYHEILVGYLDYCKKRGFATCYIWACPPVKGEDYVLYCHPETQRTPKSDKLRQWYQTMLKKATEEKIVANFSNLYEKFFVPNGESNAKVTAARLPYFDGDYWSTVADNMIKKIDQESGGDPEKQIKKMTRRSLKAMGHAKPSPREAKDILLMQTLADSISSVKEDFIVVYLQSVCSHCHEVILSGKRRFCPQCKNYQLCERCHDKEQNSGQGESHISFSGQKHALSQETVNDVPADTEDNDAVMNNCVLANRDTFLDFCQGNHYQFDSFRRAKHSSMMILYHLHNQKESSVGLSCSLCLECIGSDQIWNCEMCPNFNVCCLCYQRSKATCHSHSLICRPPVNSGMASEVADKVEELLNVLVHASHCKSSTDCHCSYPKCDDVRKLFSHACNCSIQASDGCLHCRKTWFILKLHSQRCKDSNCTIPRCTDLKKHAVKLETKCNTGFKKSLPIASQHPVM